MAVVVTIVALAMATAVAVTLWPSSVAHRPSSSGIASPLRAGSGSSVEHAAGSAPSNGGVLAGGTAGGATAAGSAGTGNAASGAGSAASGAGSAASGAGTGSASSAPSAATPLAQAKVVENGQIGLQVAKGSVTSTVNALTVLAAGEGGFVAASAESTSAGVPGGSVTLRIPNPAFADALTKVRAMGKVQSSSVTGQDVTAQYQDLADQITALRQAQTQDLTIMTRANTVGDILAVQQQINSVDSQLQQLVGQQKVLDDQTTYATLSISVRQPGSPAPRPVPKHGAWATAFLRAGNGFADGLQGLISASGALAFALLVGLAVGLIGLAVWRRYLRPLVPAAGE